MSNEQAPESCPFCGAAQKYRVVLGWYECETVFAPDGDRITQTLACAAAERERLTRERDAALDRVKVLEALIGQWVRKHERVYVAGGWDYDKEGVAMMDASKVLLGLTAKEATP